MESLATINSLEGRICFFGDKNTILIYEIDIQQWTKQQLRETQEPQQLLDENEIPCYQDLPQYMQQTNLNRSIINNYSQIPSLSHKNSQQNSYQFNSYGASVSISGSRILIFGGGKSQQTLEITFVEGEIFSAAKKDMPLARKEHSAVILNNNKVLVMGGYNQQREEMLSSCHIYNYSDDSWTEVASMNVAKCAFAAAIDSNNQYIFTFGGFDSEKRLNLIERYDILNDVWEILDLQLPQPLSNAAAISFNERKPLTQSQISQNEGSIFILGGGHDEGFSHEVLKMNVEDLSLIKISDMDTGKDLRNKIIIDGNYLYTIGGNHFQNDRFDLLNQRWETLPSYFPLVVDNLDSWTQSFIITSSIIPVAAERKPKRQIQRKQSLKLNCYQIDPVQSKDYQNGISLGNLPPHLQIPSILLNQELNSQENIAEQEGINRRIKLVQPNQNR